MLRPSPQLHSVWGWALWRDASLSLRHERHARLPQNTSQFDPDTEVFGPDTVYLKVLCRFGEPIEQEVSTVPTRFPGETYTSFDFRYKDVSLTVGKWPDREHSWIESVEIVGNAHKLKSGVRIGSTRDEVAAIFSPPEHYAQANPMEVSANIFEKQGDVGEDGITIESSGALYEITFEFDAHDRVSKVSISFSSD